MNEDISHMFDGVMNDVVGEVCDKIMNNTSSKVRMFVWSNIAIYEDGDITNNISDQLEREIEK